MKGLLKITFAIESDHDHDHEHYIFLFEGEYIDFITHQYGFKDEIMKCKSTIQSNGYRELTTPKLKEIICCDPTKP